MTINLCVVCGLKWAQDRSGLCRKCARDAGDVRTVREFDADGKRLHKAAEVRDETPPPFGSLVIGDLEFWVVWEGGNKYESPSVAAARFGRTP